MNWLEKWIDQIFERSAGLIRGQSQKAHAMEWTTYRILSVGIMFAKERNKKLLRTFSENKIKTRIIWKSSTKKKKEKKERRKQCPGRKNMSTHRKYYI